MFGYDRFYHYHHMKSRRDGYLEFYRVTRVIRSLPLIIVSIGKFKHNIRIFSFLKFKNS
jgi:hypothetical protein